MIASSGVTGAVVNAAGDVAIIGRSIARSCIPHRDPESRLQTTLACVVEVSGAIATSGTYQRGSHLIDSSLRGGGCRWPRQACAARTSDWLTPLRPPSRWAESMCSGELEDLDSYDGLMIDVRRLDARDLGLSVRECTVTDSDVASFCDGSRRSTMSRAGCVDVAPQSVAGANDSGRSTPIRTLSR